VWQGRIADSLGPMKTAIVISPDRTRTCAILVELELC
jgi:hypothetical protein